MKKILIFLVCIFVISSFCFSQEVLKSTQEEYYDFLSLSGKTERPFLGYRTLSDSIWEISDEINTPWAEKNLGNSYVFFEKENPAENWFLNGIFQGFKYKFFGPDLFTSYNTVVPYGQNDGALWQGVGFNASLSSGIRLEGYGFELTLLPKLVWMQNKDYEYLPGVMGSPYSYFWGYGIDLVQRYGDSSFWNYDFGDSEIRWSFYDFTIGFGFQTPWLGPAYLNPMLGSNNGPTYPKLDFGFRKTSVIIPGIDLYLGEFESRIWIGQLTESNYFNNDEIIDKNLINGFNISFTPAFIPHLTVGATKICLTRWGNNFWKYLNPFYNENDWSGIGEDQKASVYFDYLFPEVGFDVFAEIGIDDYTSEPVSNTFHTMIYTVGLKKSNSFKDGLNGEFIFEWNNFEMSQDFQLQWNYQGYYAHSLITEGYSQKGQMLGAGSGYFGNSQFIAYKLFYKNGESQLYIHRNCPDTNFIYNKAVNSVADSKSDLYKIYYGANRTFLTFGLSSKCLYFNDLELGLDANYSLILYNTYDGNKVGNYTHNFYFSFNVKYLF